MELRLASLLLLICASHYPLSPESGRLNVTLQSSNDQCVLLQGAKQLESGYSVDAFDLIDGGFDTFEIDPKNVGSRQFAFDPIGFEPYGPVEPSLFSNPISNVDASGNAIWDPTICDRGPYPAVYGYYEITEWGMLYEG